MPFKSRRQMRYLFANHPKMARRWVKKYGAKIRRKKNAR